MHPVIQQAMNLFRQGIISQAQLDKLMAQFTPTNTQTAPPQGETPSQVPVLGAPGNIASFPGMNPNPPQSQYPLRDDFVSSIGIRG